MNILCRKCKKCQNVGGAKYLNNFLTQHDTTGLIVFQLTNKYTGFECLESKRQKRNVLGNAALPTTFFRLAIQAMASVADWSKRFGFY